MDKLEEMFRLQANFMSLLSEKNESFPKNWPLDLSQKKNQLECRDLVFNTMQELFEAILELKNSKKHRQTELPEFNREKFVEECVDAQKFFLELLIFIGVTPDEFYKMYLKKDAVNIARLQQGY